MNNCRDMQDLIGAYLFEALEPEEMRAVQDHLKDCADCRADMQSQSDVLGMIPDAGDSLCDHEREKIRWAVERNVYRESKQSVWGVPFWRLARGVGLAAAMACIFLAGIFVGISRVSSEQSTAAVRDQGPAPTVEAPNPVVPAAPKIVAPKPSGSNGCIAELPKKAQPIQATKHYRIASTKRVGKRSQPVSQIRTEHRADSSESERIASTDISREPARPATTTVAQLPPVDAGAVALPMSGDDVRPIRLPVEGD